MWLIRVRVDTYFSIPVNSLLVICSEGPVASQDVFFKHFLSKFHVSSVLCSFKVCQCRIYDINTLISCPGLIYFPLPNPYRAVLLSVQVFG